jgi:hypothetical protein
MANGDRIARTPAGHSAHVRQMGDGVRWGSTGLQHLAQRGTGSGRHFIQHSRHTILSRAVVDTGSRHATHTGANTRSSAPVQASRSRAWMVT